MRYPGFQTTFVPNSIANGHNQCLSTPHLLFFTSQTLFLCSPKYPYSHFLFTFHFHPFSFFPFHFSKTSHLHKTSLFNHRFSSQEPLRDRAGSFPDHTRGIRRDIAGVYAVFDQNDELQFIGISRNIAGSLFTHKKSVPELFGSVKVRLINIYIYYYCFFGC